MSVVEAHVLEDWQACQLQIKLDFLIFVLLHDSTYDSSCVTGAEDQFSVKQ